jgi:hypothetical protein
MRFIPLDLDNFTAISQQVDDVVNRFKVHALPCCLPPHFLHLAPQEFATQGPEEVESLREAIEQRVDDLENFYYENDLGYSLLLLLLQYPKFLLQMNARFYSRSSG